MPTLSQMQTKAHTNYQAVREKFDSIKALDNNPLLDQDPNVGSVVLQIDEYRSPEALAQNHDWEKPALLTASAKFDQDGVPQEMEWKTVRKNEYANKEMDAPVIEHTASIKIEGDNTLYSTGYYGPTAYGEFSRTEASTSVFETARHTLVDFHDHWG